MKTTSVHWNLQFVSDEPERAIETFLLTAAVRPHRRPGLWSAHAHTVFFFHWALGGRYAVQARLDHLCGGGRVRVGANCCNPLFSSALPVVKLKSGVHTASSILATLVLMR